MSDNWMIRSNTFGNCNCDTNCGCQFNVPSTHGFCQFVEGGHIEEGYFNDIPLTGLNWAFMMIWPGEISEGNGKRLVIIDEKADADQAAALDKIVSGAAGEPGSNHFSVFGSTCSEFLDTLQLPIDYGIDIQARTGHLKIPGMAEVSGSPLIDEFSGAEFHIALERSEGSFEFTHAELGKGTAKTTGEMAMQLDGTYAQFCVHHYDQDGLIRPA